MARIETDPNYSSPTFSRATASTDLFKKEDVQQVAAALSTHDHTNGKGLPMAAGSIPNGTITSAMIADGTIVAGDLADGAVTSVKIADGTIATGDLANSAVTNAKLGTDTARANLLTNGGFEIWQRGNGPFTGNYCADRWLLFSSSSTISVSRSSTADGSTAACTYTHAASGFCQVYQKVEDQGQLRGKTVTLSMRVAATVGCTVFIEDSTGSTTGTVHTGDGSTQTLSVTRPVSASATYVQAGFRMNVASGTAYIDNAMLVVGSVAADYAPLHPADDLARCLRYYEVSGAANNYPIIGGIATAASQTAYTSVGYRVTKSVTPTVTKVGTWNVLNAGQPGVGGGPAVDGFIITANSSGAGPFTAQPTTGTAYITSESNP